MSILLHQKHGLNPTMTNCYFCGEGNEILLVGALTGKFRDAGIPVEKDGKMPMSIGVVDMRPCNKCKDWMNKGILLMSIKNNTTKAEMKGPIPNPHRTGGWTVITEDAFNRMFTGDGIKEHAMKHRFMFITDEAWDSLGLPRGTVKEKCASDVVV